MPNLSLQNKARRLRIYISESDRWRGKALDSTLLELFRQQGMAGATVFRAVAGFGAHSRIHSSVVEVLSVDLPVVIEVIDTPDKIAMITDRIYPMVREGLITCEEIEIVKYTHRFLNPLPADRLVSEVMTKNVVTLTPDAPIQQAWKLMLTQAVKAVPVIDAARMVVGMLTDEDLLGRAGIQQRLSIALRMEAEEVNNELAALASSPFTVADVMTRPVFSINEDEHLGAATTQMVHAGLKRLPVVDHSGRLVGMLSRLDVLRQVADLPAEHFGAQLPSGSVKTVADIMSANIPMVNQDDDLIKLVEEFAQSNSHRLIVVDNEGKVVGLISDSDIISRIQPEKRSSILNALRQIGKPPAGKETAYDLMSPGPLTAPPDLTVVEAVKKMLAASRKWLVVVDDTNRPLGLVDRRIILEVLAAVRQKPR